MTVWLSTNLQETMNVFLSVGFILLLVYVLYSIKNKYFLAFTLTLSFWKSFLLGGCVGSACVFYLFSYDFSLAVAFFVAFSVAFGIFLSVVFFVLKRIFCVHKMPVANPKKYQKTNFIAISLICATLAFSPPFFYLMLYVSFLFSRF